MRSHGLAGLTAGAKLIAGLAEQYWDDVFPLPDDYGVETRVAPVTGLNGREGNGSLIQPLHKLPLFIARRRHGVAALSIRQLGAARNAGRRAPAGPPRRGRHSIRRPGEGGARPGPRAFARLREDAREALDGLAGKWRRSWTRRPARTRRPPARCATWSLMSRDRQPLCPAGGQCAGRRQADGAAPSAGGAPGVAMAAA